MVETAGTKFRRARQLRHLSIEDASRATKIRPRQIADLEGDEYSNFANLAYAKSYLIAYGKYLRVDTRPYMDAFADANTFGMDDYQYLSDKPLGVFRSTRLRPRQPRLKRKQVVVACSVVGVLTILLFLRLLYNTYERLGDFDKLAERRAAHERAVQEVKATDQTPGAAVPASVMPAAPAAGAVPGAIPVSSTPVPDETPMADSARLAAALATSQHAPVELPALVPPGPKTVLPAPVAAPVVPIPGDGAAMREALTAPVDPNPAPDKAASVRPVTAQHPTVFGPDDSRPQTVVNNGPARPLN